MTTLAIDIGGTKFSMAVFDDEPACVGETRPTEREGGRDVDARQISPSAGVAAVDGFIARCGIGFGGPVDFALPARGLIDSRRRLAGLPLPGLIQHI